MRTTVDIDDRVLALARGRARARGQTLGQALSELASRGYEAEQQEEAPLGDGFPVLARVEGHVITNDMVRRALDDEF